jgi:hypothetical protein
MRRDEALITENDFGGRKKRNPLVSLGNLYASKKHGIVKRAHRQRSLEMRCSLQVGRNFISLLALSDFKNGPRGIFLPRTASANGKFPLILWGTYAYSTEHYRLLSPHSAKPTERYFCRRIPLR